MKGQPMTPTNTQTTIDGLLTERDHDRERDHEHYPTPRLLVRAVLEQLLAVETRWQDGRASVVVRGCPFVAWRQLAPDVEPLRVVDVGCGSGVWASEVRRWAARERIPVHIVGIDNRAEVVGHARRWCDEVIVGDFRDVLAGQAVDGAPLSRRFDLAVSNPPFASRLKVIDLALDVAKAAIVLHTEQGLTRVKAAIALLERETPRHELRIASQISFTGRGPDRIPTDSGSTSDSRGYSATAWQRGDPRSEPRREWTCSMLSLPPEARSWTVRPGEEPASDDLPEVER
jgi:SAM-dependent methyltransferase